MLIIVPAGSIFETERRWRVPYLLYVFAILYDAQICVQGTIMVIASAVER